MESSQFRPPANFCSANEKALVKFVVCWPKYGGLPVSPLSLVSKVFEKLLKNRIVDHLEKCGLFSDFQYGFRSSESTADLLIVVSNKIATAFMRSINDLPDDIICNTAIYADITLYSKCDQTSDCG